MGLLLGDTPRECHGKTRAKQPGCHRIPSELFQGVFRYKEERFGWHLFSEGVALRRSFRIPVIAEVT